MKRKIDFLFTVLALAGLGLSFAAGCLPVDMLLPQEQPAEGLDVVQEAWDIIFNDYVEPDSLNAEELSQGAIEGMMEALDDPYSAYLDPEMYQLNTSEFAGKFEGIGANVGMRDGRIVVTSPIPGSPSDEAGIRAGDVFLEIDGQSTEGMSLIEAVNLVRGPKGTTVTLLVLHEGEIEPVEIAIVRDEIDLESVYFEMREDIAYIYISNFSERTDSELEMALESLKEAGATGIILDLRNNPGGTLPSVVDVASRFLTDGIVLDVVNNKGEHTSHPVVSQSLTTDLPVVVLVNEYSASGSEVLSGALQDYGRATIAGTTTFGKGSVNALRRLSDGSGIYITVGRWLTPNGRPIEGEGITPDYEIDVEDEAPILWAMDYLRNQG